MASQQFHARVAQFRAQQAREQMLRDEVEAYEEYARREMAARPTPIGLEDFKEEDLRRVDHRYEKYVDGVLRRLRDELMCHQGYRDDTTFQTAVSLIELAAADWNDFTFSDAQRFLKTYAPNYRDPRGPADLPKNFVEQKWNAARRFWIAKGCKPRERPDSNVVRLPIERRRNR